MPQFYKVFFEPEIYVSNVLIWDYSNRIEILKLTKDQLKKCEDELLKGLKKMPNNKLPGSNEITKKNYRSFWDYLNAPIILSINKAFKARELSASPKQALIKLTETCKQTKEAK